MHLSLVRLVTRLESAAPKHQLQFHLTDAVRQAPLDCLMQLVAWRRQWLLLHSALIHQVGYSRPLAPTWYCLAACSRDAGQAAQRHGSPLSMRPMRGRCQERRPSLEGRCLTLSEWACADVELQTDFRRGLRDQSALPLLRPWLSYHSLGLLHLSGGLLLLGLWMGQPGATRPQFLQLAPSQILYLTWNLPGNLARKSPLW